MAINASAGAKIYFCSTASPSAATASQYAALTWIEVKEVETIGEFGDVSSAVNFTALSDGRVRKLKGARDAGNIAVVCAHDPLDTGQKAVLVAEGTKFNYAFKVVVEDSADANDTDSVFYFSAKVMSAPLNIGGNSDVTKRTFNLGIDTAIVSVPSVAVS